MVVVKHLRNLCLLDATIVGVCRRLSVRVQTCPRLRLCLRCCPRRTSVKLTFPPPFYTYLPLSYPSFGDAGKKSGRGRRRSEKKVGSSPCSDIRSNSRRCSFGGGTGRRRSRGARSEGRGRKKERGLCRREGEEEERLFHRPLPFCCDGRKEQEGRH